MLCFPRASYVPKQITNENGKNIGRSNLEVGSWKSGRAKAHPLLLKNGKWGIREASSKHESEGVRRVI